MKQESQDCKVETKKYTLATSKIFHVFPIIVDNHVLQETPGTNWKFLSTIQAPTIPSEMK